MENTSDTVHPGLLVLRRLIRNQSVRRAWVASACEDLAYRKTIPMLENATPAEQEQINLFIEWI